MSQQLRSRGCCEKWPDKTGYATVKDATRAAERHREKDHTSNARAWYCPSCGQWHVMKKSDKT